MLDDGWLDTVDISIKIMDPIISLLRFVDTDQPILAEVYEGWDSMIESMRSRESVSSMGHRQRTYGPLFGIFLSPGGIRIAHLCIAWPTP